MNTYELTYIISSDASSEGAQAKTKEIESAIQQKQGVIVQQSVPVAKPLSYPIRKFSSGFVGIMEFQLAPESVKEVEDMLSKDTQVLRSLIVAKKPVRIKKEKRSKLKALFSLGSKPEEPLAPLTPPTPAVPPTEKDKDKVELKDIEQELDKILGE